MVWKGDCMAQIFHSVTIQLSFSHISDDWMAHLFHPFQPLQSLQPFHSFYPVQSLEQLQPWTQLKSTLDWSVSITSMYVDWYFITKQAYKWSKYKHIITHLKTFLTTIIWLLIKQPNALSFIQCFFHKYRMR